jgi:hypothetical protein
MKAVAETKELAKAVDAKDFEKAMSLRDAEFADQWNSYMLTTNVMVDDSKLPEKEVRFVAILSPFSLLTLDCSACELVSSTSVPLLVA